MAHITCKQCSAEYTVPCPCGWCEGEAGVLLEQKTLPFCRKCKPDAEDWPDKAARATGEWLYDSDWPPAVAREAEARRKQAEEDRGKCNGAMSARDSLDAARQWQTFAALRRKTFTGKMELLSMTPSKGNPNLWHYTWRELPE